MKKNFGKKKIIEDIIKNLSGSVWEGVDKSSYANNILVKKRDSITNTRAAKEAKINLFKYF